VSSTTLNGVAIKVVFQTPDMNYSDTLAMFESGRADDARRATAAKDAAKSALRQLRCTTHQAQDLYVIVVFDHEGHITVYVKGCCASTTKDGQGILDVEVNPDDAPWRSA